VPVSAGGSGAFGELLGRDLRDDGAGEVGDPALPERGEIVRGEPGVDLGPFGGVEVGGGAHDGGDLLPVELARGELVSDPVEPGV
jgi:hypothetical protein